MSEFVLKKWKKILVVITLLLATLFIGVFLFVRNLFSTPSIESTQLSEESVVTTKNGTIRGGSEDGIFQYLGVPYARAEERFVPAQDVENWEGTLDAIEVGPMSPQSSLLGMGGSDQEGTDNSCQNLNIWTPGINDGKKRAVMVWFHGGGFSSGTANSEDYNGANLSRNENVVVVSVNHRLGISGFLNLSAYGEKYKYSGNVGLTDIVKSLEWIQNNIENFGGDPDNVTLFGQSGGGAKVLAMMTSPYSIGMFQRGIVQSGATETMGVTFTTEDASMKLTARILEALEISGDSIEELQDIPLSKLEEASEEALQITAEEFEIPAPLSDGYAMEWGPIIDGDYMPTNPVTEESFSENGRNIDLLIGSNLNEWTRMMGGDQGVLSDEEVRAYEKAYPEKNIADANKVDTLIRLPMLKIMSHKADQNSANVYAYVFTWDESRMGASHGIEIPFVFAHQQSNEDEQNLSNQISQAWANFAKTGVPSAEGLPEWKPYDRDEGATMLLDQTSELVYGHDKELMSLLSPDYNY